MNRQANVGARIWADCQAVVDRLTLLLADLGRIRANSANADLWTEIVADARDLGFQLVQVVTVAAHDETVVDSDSEFERWCKINNACADAAAKAANANRAPEIWQLWERFSGDVLGLQQLGRQILQHQIAVCKQWTNAADQPDVPVPKPPREVWAPDFQFEVTSLPERPPQGLVKQFGASYLQLLFRWWGPLD